MKDELRSQLHAIYSANFNDGEPVGERYGSSDMVNVSEVIDFIDDHLVEFIQQEITKARINSLLDLEQWAKLHDLDKDMILDGIEHMVKSNLQTPQQPRLSHDIRIAELTQSLKEYKEE